MGRRGLYIVIAILVIAIGALEYYYRQIDEPFNTVRNSCTVDSDCQFVDRGADFSQCWAGYCPADLANANVVAVNRMSLESFRQKQLVSAGKDPNACTAPPLCTAPDPNKPIAQCVSFVCTKVVR